MQRVGDQAFVCLDCGRENREVTALCGCGLRIGEGGLRTKQLFRCMANPNPSDAAPALFCIGFTGETAPAAAS